MKNKKIKEAFMKKYSFYILLFFMFSNVGFSYTVTKETICLAAMGKNTDSLLYCLELGGDSNHKDKKGWTPIMYASLFGQIANVKLLVEKKKNNPTIADVNFADEIDGFTALMLAAMTDRLDIIKYLLEKGARIDTVNKNGFTALTFAAGNNRLDVVKFLLGKGADPNIVGKDGWTPLKWAELKGHKEVVDYLKTRGAK